MGVPPCWAWKTLQAQGKGELLGTLDVDQGAEEIVPQAHEGEEGNDGECRPGEGEDDAGEDSQFAAAINAGGFGKLVGNSDEELAKQEDVECRAEPGGDPEGFEGADPLHSGVIAEPAEKWWKRDTMVTGKGIIMVEIMMANRTPRPRNSILQKP